MKISFLKSVIALSFLFSISISSCSEKRVDHGFVVPKDKPAQALTIGWYVPVKVLGELVGHQFEPAVVKDDTVGTIMIYIVSGAQHKIDSVECGVLKAAYLIIPVNKPGNMQLAEANSITNSVVCPMSVVDQSPVLGNKFHAFGFPTYSGKVNLDVTWTGEYYRAKATIETANGLIEIAAKFEEEPFENEMVSAIFNPKASKYDFMFGKEAFQQIINGKGNLKTEGENMIKAMDLSGRPYYLKLDLGVNWIFDFEKE